jgi:hypothetical protein
MKNTLIMAAALGTLLLLGGNVPSHTEYAPAVAAAPKLSDLKGVDELRTLFNNDAGKIRLVLLLSPT